MNDEQIVQMLRQAENGAIICRLSVVLDLTQAEVKRYIQSLAEEMGEEG